MSRTTLDSCNSHDNCNDLELSSYQSPSRLLKIKAVNGALEVLLVEASAANYTYTAVSHCWGNSEAAQNIPKTTINNIQEHMTKWSSVSSLTKIFQDAVDITSRLGLEYIWIDSLCIMYMADVYGGAHLVISAAYAKDGNGGLYKRNKPYHRVEFPIWTGDTIGAMVTENDTQGLAREHDIMLARRIVHFTSSELVWECRSQVDCECGDLQDIGAYWSELGNGKTVKTKYFEIARWGNDLQRLNFWHDMTSQFSARKGTMPRNLLWWSEYANTELFPRQYLHEATHVRSKDKSIPSWSWLSIESRVSTWGKAPLTLALILNIRYTLATDNIYGACKEGEIQLLAKRSSIKVSMTTQEDGLSLFEVHREDTRPFEYSEDELSGLQMIALQFSLTNITIESMILCRENKGPAKCGRVGIAAVSEEIFKGARLEEVVLI
ncbi:heterokaryon incompatibility protein-domain-containing protein [Hypoxylon sp. FL1150]|nr:heterokaryon incompatibility protein-domain-containing protein [Hypoxylon sp. FL1150]